MVISFIIRVTFSSLYSCSDMLNLFWDIKFHRLAHVVLLQISFWYFHALQTGYRGKVSAILHTWFPIYLNLLKELLRFFVILILFSRSQILYSAVKLSLLVSTRYWLHFLWYFNRFLLRRAKVQVFGNFYGETVYVFPAWVFSDS